MRHAVHDAPDSDREKAVAALGSLAPSRADDRDAWIKVGMALHSVDSNLFSEWDRWSQQSEKYDSTECERQWNSFHRTADGVKLGSLLRWAKEDAIANQENSIARSTRSNNPRPTVRPGKRKAVVAKFPSIEAAAQHLATHVSGTVTGNWMYQAASGDPAFVVVRIDCAGSDGSADKTFRPLCPHEGGWTFGDPQGPLPLYGLPGILSRPHELVLVVEGEKCAEALHRLGFVATTSAHGARSSAKTDWSPLANREVAILPDNDESGRAYAADVTKILATLPKPARTRVVAFPDLPIKGDVVDFITRLRSQAMSDDAIRAEIQHHVEKTPSSGLRLTKASSVRTKAVEWVWTDRIPRGKLTILSGDPDLAKTLVAMDIVARYTRGGSMPGCESATTPRGTATCVSAEDDLADTLVPRLHAAGADLDKVQFIELEIHQPSESGSPTVRCFSLDDLPLLESALDRDPTIGLVVIDPITAFMGSTDTHRDAEVRACLLRLQQIAHRRQVAILAIQHLNKAAGLDPKYRVTGSLAFVAAARSVLVAALHPDDRKKPIREARRILARTKNNLTGADASLIYTVSTKQIRLDDGSIRDVPFVVWEETSTLQATDLLGAGALPQTRMRDAAIEFLEEALALGPQTKQALMQRAAELEIGERTLERAARDLAIRKRPGGFGGSWIWSLPLPVIPSVDPPRHTGGVVDTEQVGRLRGGSIQSFGPKVSNDSSVELVDSETLEQKPVQAQPTPGDRRRSDLAAELADTGNGERTAPHNARSSDSTAGQSSSVRQPPKASGLVDTGPSCNEEFLVDPEADPGSLDEES